MGTTNETSAPGSASSEQENELPCAAIILAAGKSTRMRSKTPKPLHPICGLPLTGHVIRACREAGVGRIIVVVRHEAEAVKAGLGDSVEYVMQSDEPGTGSAVRAAQSLLGDWPGTILVLLGDVPLLPGSALTRLRQHHESGGAALTLLTAITDDPTGYGRVVREPLGDPAGRVVRIVEEKDCTPEQRAIKEWNPSVYAFQSAALWNALGNLRPNNAQGEYYLTDTIEILNGQAGRVEAIATEDADDVRGINDRVQLEECRHILNDRLLKTLMLSGVTVIDPSSVYVDVDVQIGQDTTIAPNTHLRRGTQIGEDCAIGPNAIIASSRIGSGVTVLASQVVESVLEDGVRVGPFANLRAKTHLGPKVKIGDFVETKNAVFHAGAQASHLSYIGDAEIGAKTNLGAGTITCNYDGYRKHRTVVGANAFIGTHSTLVAPVTIGDGAFIAAASPITEDVPRRRARYRPRPSHDQRRMGGSLSRNPPGGKGGRCRAVRRDRERRSQIIEGYNFYEIWCRRQEKPRPNQNLLLILP